MSDFGEMMTRANGIRDQYADLETAKYGQPWTPTEIALGFVGDVGDLAKLVMTHEGVRGDMPPKELAERLDHELGDCLLVLQWLARATGRDLGVAFEKTATELEARIEQEMSR